jgi:broad specificity phosphatase PhoE
LQGQQDIALNALGRRQAVRAGQKLRKIFQAGRIDAAALLWQTSPLLRTRDTMTLARAQLSLPADGVRVEERLKEFTFGSWEGKTWPEVVAEDPKVAAARDRDKWGFCPPGGESYADLAQRLRPWLDEQKAPTVVVSHGGVARALMHLVGKLPTERAPTADIFQGRVLVFSKERFDWL